MDVCPKCGHKPAGLPALLRYQYGSSMVEAGSIRELEFAHYAAVSAAAEAEDLEMLEHFNRLHRIGRWSFGWTDADEARERQEKAERLHVEAAWRADEAVKAAHLGTNGYLHRAGFPDMQALVADDGALVLPIRHLTTGELRAVQLVRWDSELREFNLSFPFGLPPLSVLRIGANRKQTTLVCQSYVAALSLKAALEQMRMQASVLVTFSDFNQRQVLAALANAPYARVVAPEDANEVHQARGLLPLCRVVMDAVRGT